ncbi:unnamed protein product [Schistosoma mattheei]|uniref:Uncharacterized protein n=1 Tax=Schistosoma mattheei TaxID=31246 RepID=A0A3P8BYY1_9TREM|nr:unnamed protein product [Schistosoma mattheei]
MYGAETLQTSTTTIKKIQALVNSCLRKILNFPWPDTINNHPLWLGTNKISHETLEVDRTYITEITKLYHEPSLDSEAST